MGSLRIAGFSGLVPRTAKQLIGPNQAQIATNCILTSGDLRSRNGPLLIATPIVTGEIQSMFRMEKDGNEKWLAWDKDVDVARSPIAANTERRFYYTGDGEPRVSDYDTATAGTGPYPSGCYVLGVSPPITKPTVTPTGGVGAVVSRTYVYTYVTQWGEESAPSPVSTVTTGKVDDSWALSLMDAPPPNSGTVTAALKDAPSAGYVQITLNTVFGLRAGETITFAAVVGMTDINATFTLFSVDVALKKIVIILTTTQTYSSGGTWTRQAPHNTAAMTKRIYRTVTSASTGTKYRYLVTIAAVTTTYADTISDTVAALGEVIPSTAWLMPPADMKGIIIMANGIACGFFGNQVCFSEPFEPYAWPDAYRQTYDQDIVAIGINGTTLVGMTQGNPFTITGVDPVTMGGGMEAMGVAWPCMSKNSVATFAFGVGYAAPQGFVIIGPTVDVVTKDLFTQKEWAELNPSTFISASADNRYYSGYYADGSFLMFVIDKAEAASFIKINQKITDMWVDPWTGLLYIATDKKIYQWEGEPSTKLSYEWKSKKFVMAPPTNFGAAKIDCDFTQAEDAISGSQATAAAALAANQLLISSNAMNDGLADPYLGEYEIGGDEMLPLPALSIDSLQFQLWADDQLKLSRNVINNRAFRLPAGYKADNIEIVLSGNVKVTGVVLAETMDGLKQS